MTAPKHHTDGQQRHKEDSKTVDSFERSLIPIPYGSLPNFNDQLFSDYLGLTEVTIDRQRCSISEAFKRLELDSIAQTLRTHQEKSWSMRFVTWLFNVGHIRDQQKLYRCYQYQEWLQKIKRVQQEGLILQGEYPAWIQELQHASPSWRQPAFWEYLCYRLMRLVSTKPEETLLRWLEAWGDTRHIFIGQWIKNLLLFTLSGVFATLLAQWLNRVEQDIQKTALWCEKLTEEEYDLSLIIHQAEQLQKVEEPWLTGEKQLINLDPHFLTRASRKLALRFHPDKGNDAERFKVLEEAKARIAEAEVFGYQIDFKWLRYEVQQRQEADADDGKRMLYELIKRFKPSRVRQERELRNKQLEIAKKDLEIARKDAIIAEVRAESETLRAKSETLRAENEELLLLLRKHSPAVAEEYEKNHPRRRGLKDVSSTLICYVSPIHQGNSDSSTQEGTSRVVCLR